MAHIRSGSIVSDIRGKVGTEIYSRNKGGAYVKAFTSPVQPDTQPQLDARADMGTAVAAWQALTNEDRRQWNILASSRRESNRIGIKTSKSGYNLFIRRKLHALAIGSSDDPQYDALPIINNPVASILDLFEDEFEIRTTADVTVFSESFLFFCSPPVSAGIMSPNSVTYTFITSFGQFSNSTPDITTQYEAVHGSLVGQAGKKIFLKAVPLFRRASNYPLLDANNKVFDVFFPPSYDNAVIQTP